MHFTVLITNTDKRSVNSQLERFYEQGDENDYFMRRDIEVEASEVESEARRILEQWIAMEGKGASLSVRYQSLVASGHFRRVCQDWYGGEWDDEGNLYHLSNPDATWDWYQIGGRWMGGLPLKDGATGQLGEPGTFRNEATEGGADIAKAGDIDWDKAIPTFAILHDDVWQEKGWEPRDETDTEWDEEWKAFVRSLPADMEVTLVDCHI